MASNASRGAAAKARTKKWLIAQGYQVADLERVHWIFTSKGRLPTKRDQFASDLLAVSALEDVAPVGPTASIWFVQVKSGKSAIGGTFPDARRKFAEFSFPPSAAQVVIAWAPRARHPRIVDCTVPRLASGRTSDGSNSVVRGPAGSAPLGEETATRPTRQR